MKPPRRGGASRRPDGRFYARAARWTAPTDAPDSLKEKITPIRWIALILIMLGLVLSVM